ncbi:MAG TPA: GNAT family N-acetyltransferase [Acidimicrobiia bacterium]|nr:GNAT family N-acetyltransferase [Acidimicrobiia bacterium]
MDAAEFLLRARPLLIDEPRHNLIIGIAGTVVRRPDYYPEARFFLTPAWGAPQAGALITPPFNLVLADAAQPGAVARLADLIHGEGVGPPGVTGNRPTVDWFVERWTSLTGAKATLRMAQGVFSLSRVDPVAEVAGLARRASPSDRTLVYTWMERFGTEALPPADRHPDRLARAIELRLSPELDTGVWLWIDEQPVAMAGYGGETPTGMRVGPVYTPPAFRNRGYATRLVAELSQWLLDRGRRFCFLYTDLANPTSNNIYRQIGYQQVAESAEFGFE